LGKGPGMGNMRREYIILVKKVQKMRDNLEDQGLDGKLILEKYIYRRNIVQRSRLD